MVQIKKCRSKKHQFGGCGDPRCPEGLSIDVAIKTAAKKGDVNGFLKARSLKDIKPEILTVTDGFANLSVVDKTTFEREKFRFVVDRPEVRKAIDEMDRRTIHSFDTIDNLERYLNSEYSSYASIHVFVNESESLGVTRYSVGDLHVDADLRGMGIGGYFRKTLTKFADEHNSILTGTPTNEGDGSIENTDRRDAEFKAHALAHRNRLVKFYEKHGYEYNYAFEPAIDKDYWTGDENPVNKQWVDQLNKSGQDFLKDSESYIRWPNGEIPESMKA